MTKIKKLIETITKNDFSNEIESLNCIGCFTIEDTNTMCIQNGYRHKLDGEIYSEEEDCLDMLHSTIMEDEKLFKEHCNNNEDELDKFVDSVSLEVYDVIFNVNDEEIYKTLDKEEVFKMVEFLTLVRENYDILVEIKDEPISKVFSDHSYLVGHFCI